jgi:hypothetical protein
MDINACSDPPFEAQYQSFLNTSLTLSRSEGIQDVSGIIAGFPNLPTQVSNILSMWWDAHQVAAPMTALEGVRQGLAASLTQAEHSLDIGTLKKRNTATQETLQSKSSSVAAFALVAVSLFANAILLMIFRNFLPTWLLVLGSICMMGVSVAVAYYVSQNTNGVATTPSGPTS